MELELDIEQSSRAPVYNVYGLWYLEFGTYFLIFLGDVGAKAGNPLIKESIFI